MKTPKNIEAMTVTGANPSNNYSNAPQLNGDSYINYLNPHGIRVVGVMDGAKAPFDYTVNGLPNDAYASNIMQSLLEYHFESVSVLKNWDVAFNTCIRGYRSAFDRVRFLHSQFKSEDYRYFNAACAFALAIIDENNGDCILLQATDCYAVVRCNGQLYNLSHYDEKAIEKSGLVDRDPLLSDWLNMGKTLDEAKALENERVLKNRKNVYNKCLSPNFMGMAVMNGDPLLMNNMQVDKFNLNDAQTDALVLMSDGYMCKHDDIVLTAQGALGSSAKSFYQKEIVPLWGSSDKDVMTDITCMVVKY